MVRYTDIVSRFAPDYFQHFNNYENRHFQLKNAESVTPVYRRGQKTPINRRGTISRDWMDLEASIFCGLFDCEETGFTIMCGPNLLNKCRRGHILPVSWYLMRHRPTWVDFAEDNCLGILNFDYELPAPRGPNGMVRKHVACVRLNRECRRGRKTVGVPSCEPVWYDYLSLAGPSLLWTLGFDPNYPAKDYYPAETTLPAKTAAELSKAEQGHLLRSEGYTYIATQQAAATA